MVTRADFLNAVLPWPGSNPGFVNLHWLIPAPNDPTKQIWVGKPTTNPAEFENLLAWVLTLPNVSDIYMCMSRQAKTGLTRNNKIKAAKHAADALALKALWLDVDVKDPPKGYANLGEAIDAVLMFVKTVGLPPPSALVHSGGGLHVYWTSISDLTPADWKPYAEGLKALALQHGLRCDAGVTADAARVLRVPGTYNFKHGQKRPVKILHLGAPYDFATQLAFLKAVTPVAGPSHAAPAFDLSGWIKPKLSEALPMESLSAGLGYEEITLDPTPILRQCKFFQDALLTGGKDYSQPMWNLSTLGATWMVNGRDLAHKMGKDHTAYTKAETDALYDRKLSERKVGGVGWPSCSAVKAAGCTSCAACPHFAAGKSPLNLGRNVAAAAAPAAAAVTAAVTAAGDLKLPHGYVVSKNGFIAALVETEVEDGPPVVEEMDLFWCTVSDVQAQYPDALNFTVSTDLHNRRGVSIPMKDFSGYKLYDKLMEQGVKMNPRAKRHLEDLFMSWMKKLHESEEAIKANPFGWYIEDGKRHGFCFGGKIMRDAGRTDLPSGYGDANLRNDYLPTGSLDVWLQAHNMLIAEHRPEMQIIMAAAFASPLMASTGEYSCMLSVNGEPGCGKSSALRVGCAVWGSPQLAKEAGLSTVRSIVNKVGAIKNLPIYRDELTQEKHFEQTFEQLFELTNGVEGSRLNSQIQLNCRGTWQNMSVICANMSFASFVAGKQKNTTAGVYRVFEVDAFRPASNAPGRIAGLTPGRMLQELDQNHGMMGLKYARLLADDPAAIDKFVFDTTEEFSGIMGYMPGSEERYWSALCGTVLSGAILANSIGCKFDIDLIRACLLSKLQDMRKAVAFEGHNGGTANDTEIQMTAFFKDVYDRMVWTSIVPALQRAGRPAPVEVLWPLSQNGYHREGPVVQWGVNNRMLLVSRKALTEWCDTNKIPRRQIVGALEKHFGAKFDERTGLCKGTGWRCGREHLIILDVPPNSPWDVMLQAHNKVIV